MTDKRITQETLEQLTDELVEGAPLGLALRELSILRSERAELRSELAWYGEQARLARLIHSEGDAGRHALTEDGGKRARAALELTSDKP